MSTIITFFQFNSIHFISKYKQITKQWGVNKELCFTSKWNNNNTWSNTIILHLQAKAKYKLRKTSKKTYRAQGDGVGGGP